MKGKAKRRRMAATFTAPAPVRFTRAMSRLAVAASVAAEAFEALKAADRRAVERLAAINGEGVTE